MHQPENSVEGPGFFNAFSFVVPDLHGDIVHKYAAPHFLNENMLSYFMSLQTLYRISVEGTKFMLKADPRKMDLKGFLQRAAEVPALIVVPGS